MSSERLCASRDLIRSLNDSGRRQAKLLSKMEVDSDESLIAQQLLDGIQALTSIAQCQHSLLISITMRQKIATGSVSFN